MPEDGLPPDRASHGELPPDRASHGELPPDRASHGELPPDPWAEEGVDLWALEQAEELAREGVPLDHPAWDRVDGAPTLDDFDEAADELEKLEAPVRTTGSPSVLVRVAFALIALALVAALLLLYVTR